MSYNINCTICTKQFDSKIQHKKTCSVGCRKILTEGNRHRFYYKDREKHNGLCEWCKNVIENRRSNSRYCSKECSKHKQYDILEYENTCINCNKQYTSKNKKSKFCSISCSNTNNKKHEDIKKTCEECKQEFTTTYIRRNKRFCTKSCATKYDNHIKFSDDIIKEKISNTKKNNYKSGKIVHPWVGRNHSEETKQKISRHHIENKTFNGENNPMYGKNHTNNTKEKISYTRVNNILNGNYHDWFLKGKFKSIKNNKEYIYRSSWELICYQYLEFNESVKEYIAEPFSLEYFYNKTTKNYIPDLLIINYDGSKKLIEIKPKYYLEYDINKQKFKAAEEYCSKNNIIFEIWSEEHIENFKKQTNYLQNHDKQQCSSE